ncbi:hypothetical protein [Desulfoscipio gibsoniae]
MPGYADWLLNRLAGLFGSIGAPERARRRGWWSKRWSKQPAVLLNNNGGIGRSRDSFFPSHATVFKKIVGRRPATALVVALTCLLLIPPGAAGVAPDKPVQLKAEIGWQGKGVPGRYIPAVVKVENTGDHDLAGVLQVINYNKSMHAPPPGSPSGTQPVTSYFPAAAFGEKISLPAGGTKKVTLWFPMNESGERVDFVWQTGDKELARITAKVPKTNVSGPLPGAIGVLGDIPPALERARLIMPDGAPRIPLVLQLSGELFPRRVGELNAFSTILVTGGGAVELNSEQRQVLNEWVKGGGILAVSGGLEIEDALSALPAGAVAVHVEQIGQQKAWGPAADWLNVTAGPSAAAPLARLSGDGKSWGPAGLALGESFSVGYGQIVVLGFSPSQVPWQSGALGEGLWKKFLTMSSMEQRNYDANYSENRLGNLMHLTDNLPASAYPGWHSVGLFLLVFIAAAGPGVYWLLRRYGRPEYTWLAVPLLAVLFTGAVYLYMLRTGGNVLVNVVQVVDNRQNGQLTGYTAVGCFAPTLANFTATLEEPDRAVQVLPQGGRSPEYMGEKDNPVYSVIRGSDLAVHFNDTSQWHTRAFAFQNNDLAETMRDVTAVVNVQGNKITGRVYNKTNMQLDHVVMFLGSRYKVAGDLPPGGSATMEIEVGVPRYNAGGQSRPDFECPSSWQVFMYPDGPPVASKQGMSAEPSVNRRLDVSEQRRANLLDNCRDGILHRGPVETGWPLTVLAWSDSPGGDLGVKELFRPPHYLTVLVLEPEIKLPAGSFAIPAGMVVPEVVESQIRGMSGHDNLRIMEGGSITLGFKPRLPADASLNKIGVQFDYFAAGGNGKGLSSPAARPGAVPEGVLEVYHPGKNIWQPLSGSGIFNLTGDYAVSSGEVLLRITGGDPKKGTGFYFLTPTVAYEGVNGGGNR